MKKQLSAQEVLEQMRRTQKNKSFIDVLATSTAQLLSAILKVALWGVGICGLWNAVIPDIFGLPLITYSQAIQLYLLTSLLFDVSSSASNTKQGVK